MIGTIAPAVGRTSRTRASAAGALSYVLGSMGSGAALGVLVAWLGRAVRSGVPHWPQAVWAAFGCVAVLMGLREYGVVHIPLPHPTRQVAESWRWRWSPWVAWGLYGLGLGHGLMTIVPFASYYVMLLGVLLMANPWIGALVMAAHGLMRALPALAIGLTGGDRDDIGAAGIVYLFRRTAVIRAANGAFLLAFGALFLAESAHLGGGA